MSEVIAWGVREPVNNTDSVFHDEETAESEARQVDGDLVELVERGEDAHILADVRYVLSHPQEGPGEVAALDEHIDRIALAARVTQRHTHVERLRATALLLDPVIMEVDDFALGPIYGVDHGYVRLSDILSEEDWDHAMGHPEVERFMKQLARVLP